MVVPPSSPQASSRSGFECWFTDLISGQKKGVFSDFLRGTLWGFSKIYGLGVRIQNLSYDLGIRRIRKAPVPVVSVGNLTTGGTGKTPICAWLGNWFRAQGAKPGFVSRGYRAKAGKPNDEGLVLELLSPEVPRVQDRKRFRGCRRAAQELGCNLIILDDGMQHRRLARDLEIVLLDALNPWGYGSLLPRGLLREPRTGLARADIVLITRASHRPLDLLRKEISRFAPKALIAEVEMPPSRLRNALGQTSEFEGLRGKRVLAFCGIGNPEGFRETIWELSCDLIELALFNDHHHYSPKDLSYLAERAEMLKPDAILTTLKDLVKIPKTELAGSPLWGLETEVRILRGEAELFSTLRGFLNRLPRGNKQQLLTD